MGLIKNMEKVSFSIEVVTSTKAILLKTPSKGMARSFTKEVLMDTLKVNKFLMLFEQ